MDLTLVDESRESSTHDANELLAIVCNRDTLLQKKRRWLERPPYHTYRSKLMRRKIPKFLLEKFIPESYVRSDEVSCDIVRSTVREGFRFSCNHLSEHHVVAHSFEPLDSHVMENKERTLSTIRDLTNSALYSIACIVAPNNLKFKTRSELIAVVKDQLTNYLLDASREADGFCQLSELFKNPNSYLQNNLKIVTLVTDNLLQSIYKTMERLDELTIRELYATFRRLTGAKVIPHFPPVLMKHHYSTQSFLLKVKKLFHKHLSSLQEGQEIPKEFASGLTVILLSIYSRLGPTTVPISEFCLFPKEVMHTQKEILHAIRLLHKLQKEDIETLIPLIDPAGTVPRVSFRKPLKSICLSVCLYVMK